MMSKMLQISCISNHFYPQTAENFRKLCQMAGIDCIQAETLTCCGLPYFERGELNAAKKAGEYNLNTIGQNQLVCSSFKCLSAYNSHYPKLFNNTVSHNAAVALSKNSIGLRDILQRIPENKLKSIRGHYFLVRECCAGSPTEHTETFLSGCKWSYPALLASCCGAGAGMPSFNGESSMKLSQKMIAEFQASGAEAIVCEDDICRKQLELAAAESGLNLTILNIVDIICQ